MLLVDERAPDDTALRLAVEALGRLGAREIRTLLLFGGGRASADYSGPQVDVLVIQPWIRDAVLSPRSAAPTGSPRRDAAVPSPPGTETR